MEENKYCSHSQKGDKWEQKNTDLLLYYEYDERFLSN